MKSTVFILNCKSKFYFKWPNSKYFFFLSSDVIYIVINSIDLINEDY